MSIKNLAKVIKASFGKYLYRTVCVLLILTVMTAWSVSGLYAKYISSADVNGSSKVGNGGISTFELKEHELKAPDKLDDDEIADMVKDNAISVLGETEIISSNTTYSVPPGVDIPKDPFVRLQMKSDVSYELYVKVTESENFPKELVTYNLTNRWYLYAEDEENGVYTYKYIVNPGSEADKYIFTAGTPYDYNDGSEIQILQDDKIHVGENYSIVINNDLVSFSIKFEAYVRQVLHTA